MSLYGLSWCSVIRTLCFRWREYGCNPWVHNQDPACPMPTSPPAPQSVCKRRHVKSRPCSSGKELCPSNQEQRGRCSSHLIVQKLIISTDYLLSIFSADTWLLTSLLISTCIWILEKEEKKKKEMKFPVISLLVRHSLKRKQENIVESKRIETTGQKVLFFYL